MNPTAFRRQRSLPALSCLALCALSACAVPVTQEPLYDYGMGQYRSLAEWQGSAPLQTATPAPLMDYGVALFDGAPSAAGTAQARREDLPRLASR